MKVKEGKEVSGIEEMKHGNDREVKEGKKEVSRNEGGSEESEEI